MPRKKESLSFSWDRATRYSDGAVLSVCFTPKGKMEANLATDDNKLRPVTRAHMEAACSADRAVYVHATHGRHSPLLQCLVKVGAPVTVGKVLKALQRFYAKPLPAGIASHMDAWEPRQQPPTTYGEAAFNHRRVFVEELTLEPGKGIVKVSFGT